MSDLDATAAVRLHGWHWTEGFCREKLARSEMLHLLAEASNVCDQDCEYCYTVPVALDSPRFHSRQLAGELSLEERKGLIAQAVKLGARTYDVVGAGEPFLDRLFLPQVEYAAEQGLIPVIFTNGSALGDQQKGRRLAEQLFGLGASIIVKWHSASREVHDMIVRRHGAGELRDHALAILKEVGFNRTNPTRLGIDNVVYNNTIAEIPECLRMCRRENLFLVCSTFIPVGRTRKGNEKEVPRPEVERLFAKCARIDKEEFGLRHSADMPYLGYGRTCTQCLGLYVTIQGEVYNCVGQTESYGNIRQQRPLVEMWQQRLPYLRSCYDGSCPSRFR